MRHFIIHTCSIILFLLAAQSLGAQDKTLFSIGDEEVSISGFKYIYEKNNRDKADYSEQSLKEYLELYINFKLKVHKAKEQGYDDTDTYKAELQGYRQQLADSYIIDKEVIVKMAEEIERRQKNDVELQHIFVTAAEKSSRERLEEARITIQDIKSKIDDGLPWENAVNLYSQDRSSAAYGGDIGYINAPLPEGFVALENQAYLIKPGQISEPVQTKNGYHIIKVVSKRPARGSMEGKHLLIRKEKNGIPLANAYPRIKKIYDEIKGGTRTFEQATIVSSEDTDTKGNEGYLGFFTIGQYDRAFEDAAFAITEDGGISEPVETSVGWHIIKRVSKKPLDDISVIQERIKNAPLQGERFEKMRDIVVNDIKAEANFSEDIDLLNKYIQGLNEDYYTYRWRIGGTDGGVLLSYGDDKYGLADFADFLKINSKARMKDKDRRSISASVYELYEEFVIEKAIAYAEDRLEDRYPEFKNLMREYREGILLFDIAKDQIWDKAASDTTAISRFFDQHSANYQWEERYKLSQYTVRSITPTEITNILNTARTTETSKDLIEKFNTDKELILRKEEILEKGHKSLDGMIMRKGFVSAPKFNNKLQLTTFTKVEEVIPAQAKSLKEARGYVISDYQDQLDKEWIAALREEYKVKINQKRLRSLYK